MAMVDLSWNGYKEQRLLSSCSFLSASWLWMLPPVASWPGRRDGRDLQATVPNKASLSCSVGHFVTTLRKVTHKQVPGHPKVPMVRLLYTSSHGPTAMSSLETEFDITLLMSTLDGDNVGCVQQSKIRAAEGPA